MPSLERFFAPSIRFQDSNLKSLPGAKLYFYAAGTSTPKSTFQDKVGGTPHAHPVVADSNGIFPPIFLSGLYRVELRSAGDIVQPGWPIDNVGQDFTVAPFAAWSEIVTYQTNDVVTGDDGAWYMSLVDGNLGNDPDAGGSPSEWRLLVDASEVGVTISLASSGTFTSGSLTLTKAFGIVTAVGSGSHSSATSVSSASGSIPAGYRPASGALNVYDANGTRVAIAQITSTGELSVAYRDWAGTLVAQTSTGPLTITYRAAT